MNDILNNREIAISICILLFFIWVLSLKADLQKNFLRLFNVIFTTNLIDYFLSIIIYVMSIILILVLIGFWDFSLLKDSVFWLVFAGFPLFMKITELKNSNHFAKEILKRSFKGIIIVEFLSNFYTFNLIIELFLIIFLTLVNILPIFKPDKILKKFTSNVNMVFGFIVMIYIGYNLYQNTFGFLNLNTLKSFVLPFILTISLIPFLYLVALLDLYDIMYRRMSMDLKEQNLKWYLKYKLLLSFKFNLKKLRVFQSKIGFEKITQKKHINKNIKEFKSTTK